MTAEKATEEKPATTAPEPKPEATETPKTEAQPKIEDMSPEETEQMMKDMPPPADYVNNDIHEETPADEKPATETPKEETKPEAKKTEDKPSNPEFFERLEEEMEKPEGKEDLNDFNARERAYFHQMRRDRKLRQKAEEERDRLAFEKLQKEKKEKPEKPEEEENEDPFADRDDDEMLTVADAKKLLEKKEKPEEKPTPPPVNTQANVKYLTMCENEARANHPEDFDSVMELADELVSNNSEKLEKIAIRVHKGDNPAEVMYELIKEDPEFEKLYPAAEIRAKNRLKSKAEKKVPKKEEPAPKKAEDTTEAEEALEKNANPTQTTAHVSSREEKPADEMTMQELDNMSDLEFAKLPRHVRQKYLKKYGA